MHYSKNKKDTERKAETSTIKEAINQLLETYKIKGKMDELQIIQHWSKLMGEPIARRTSHVYLRDKILFVQLSSASLKNELAMSKSKIVELFNRELGEATILDVKFL